jgi:hypothetical protein
MVTALAILSLAVLHALAEQPKAAIETRNLMDLIHAWPATPLPADSKFRLAPEWVGTVKRVYLRGGEGIYGEDKPDNIRFTHAWVRKVETGALQLVIMRPPYCVESEMPVYRAQLPTAEEVSRFQSLDDLRKVFGPQHGWTDGWGGPGGMHWTEAWRWFTVEREDRIRFLDVFAHVHKQGRVGPSGTIDILVLREGIFRPADPESALEREKFKTGDELAALEQAKRRAENEKYPLPLRSLISARYAPDDSDLVAYTKALNALRAKPSPELLRQLVEQSSSDEVEFSMMLSDLLSRKSAYLHLDPWGTEPRKATLRGSIEALSAAKTDGAFCAVVKQILVAFGGGTLVVRKPSSEVLVNVSVKISANSEQWSDGSSPIPEKQLPAVIEATQRTLRKEHPELWPKVK